MVAVTVMKLHSDECHWASLGHSELSLIQYSSRMQTYCLFSGEIPLLYVGTLLMNGTYIMVVCLPTDNSVNECVRDVLSCFIRLILAVLKFKYSSKTRPTVLWLLMLWLLSSPGHQHMMTSSNGNIFHITGHLCGEFTCPGEFPTQRPVTQSFDVFFDLCLYKRLSKQSWGWWF